jgi:hypothetical protein
MMSNLSPAEILFVDIFCSLFGEGKRDYLLQAHNFPFLDSEGKRRYHDFVVVLEDKKIAIEVEGESYHNPAIVGLDKYSDDILRANAQIIQGWTRISFTPKNLAEKPEVVKKQLKEIFGSDPHFIQVSGIPQDRSYKELPLNRKVTVSIRKPIFQTVEDSPYYPNLLEYAGKYNLALELNKKKGGLDDLINFVIYRTQLALLELLCPNLEDFDGQTTIQNFIKRYKKEKILITDILTELENFSIRNLEDFHRNRVITFKKAIESIKETPHLLQILCQQVNTLSDLMYSHHAGVSIENNYEKDYESSSEFYQDIKLLKVFYYLVKELFIVLSYLHAPPRHAIIGVDNHPKRFKYTLLDKTQYETVGNFTLPTNFYNYYVPSIVYLCSLKGEKIEEILMGDNKFNISKDFECNLPAEEDELKGHLQDVIYHNLNHAIVNRYFVELKPAEFIINAYNIKSITLLDSSDPGKISFYFKVKYTNGTIELGSVFFDEGHECPLNDCPLKKYNLRFIPEYSSNRSYHFASFGHWAFAETNLRKIMPLISACYRDLNVLEVETKYFTKGSKSFKKNIKDSEGKLLPKADRYWTKVVWLPRKKIIYNKRNKKQTETLIREFIPVFVQGHLRRCENPSEAQIKLANEFGLIPPVGYTFVRPHKRHVDRNQLVQYRSKSALIILYGQN